MGYKHLKFPENTLFLVTGAAGFIGSNLCEAILNMGYKVRALDDLSTGKQENIDIFSVRRFAARWVRTFLGQSLHNRRGQSA